MSTFEIIASISSIISIPLAIYYARKTNDATSEKARMDILKTLSYRLSDTLNLTYDDIDSVYKSKLREHKIVQPKFTQEDILNDLKTDIMSNAFLVNDIRDNILYNLSLIHFEHKTKKIIINTFWKPLVKVFISPLPFILFISNIISCLVLLYPCILKIISSIVFLHEIDIECKDYIIFYFYANTSLHINLISLLSLSAICFFRKRFINNYSF